jgi:hypothetical protein
MATIHHALNGSSPHRFHGFPRGSVEQASAGGAISPEVGDIISPELRASLRGDGDPSPLWAHVLSEARTLNMDKSDRALLEGTRLRDLIGECAHVSVPAETLSADREWVLQRLLTAAVRQAGLRGYRVRLHFTSTRGACDAE